MIIIRYLQGETRGTMSGRSLDKDSFFEYAQILRSSMRYFIHQKTSSMGSIVYRKGAGNIETIAYPTNTDSVEKISIIKERE